MLKNINKNGWIVITVYFVITLLVSVLMQTLIFKADEDVLFDIFGGWLVSLAIGVLLVKFSPINKVIFNQRF